MTESILNDLKKVCGMDPEYTAFDQDLMMHINAEFAVLNQIGLGPAQGFMITDATAVWDDFLEGELRLNMVKTYMYLKMRLIFDPPTTSYLIAAYEKQAEMYLWRAREFREGVAWTPPQPASSTTSLD